jgi:hypothetical protein
VFNEENIFTAIYHIDMDIEFNKIYIPNWGLPQGKYTYIAWINYHHAMFEVDPCILGKTTLTQTLLKFLVPDTKLVNNTYEIPLLCFGHLDNDQLKSTNQLITIPVMHITNRINLKITGLKNESNMRASSAINHLYEFTIVDNNGVYGCDGNFIYHDYFAYSTTRYAESDELNMALTVLKLSEFRKPILTITNKTTNTKIFTGNLVEYILSSNPNNDFEKTHTYNIEIDFDDEVEAQVTITINGWVLNPADYELNND